MSCMRPKQATLHIVPSLKTSLMLEGKTEEAGEGFTSLVLGQVMEVILPIRLENVPPVNDKRNFLF